MKRILLFLFVPTILFAQDPPSLFVNLQLHRDFKRELFTSTVEVFGMDNRGSTFMFADFDYGGNGQQLSYFEISRNILIKTLHWGAVSGSIQYNDGVQSFDVTLNKKSIPRTVLGGVSFSGINFGTFTTELQALLRQEFASDIGWQLTAVWYSPIGTTPLEFLGYIDINTNKYDPNDKISFQAEPQLQCRFLQRCYFGTEIEISRNFTGAWTPEDGFKYDKLYILPTLFLRYDL